MRLIADGATPIPRMVPVEDLGTDDGYAFEPAEPFFLGVGDRIAFEGGRLVVVRVSGEKLAPAGSWAARCRLRAGGSDRPTAVRVRTARG
ncbi:hypothetical protein QEZ40_002595 [Streptomyces katrae]|uniref:Uncharacterized protein n=1 Tax=Streptomyces katrae TaxID=68223 RepID=A0ABT7GVJ5_9ACTN|nr:hypothetical protein [Streptomyces katrae]MDK9497652.1 hypothetical protein [Streptomyces katrae]